MYFNLPCGTDSATVVLFDPGAIHPLLEHRSFAPQDFEKEACKGNLVLWYTEADGAYSFRVYVDEAMPASLQDKASSLAQGRLLRVPTGRLFASGGECIGPRDRHIVSEEFELALPHMGSNAAMPPGNYSVDAYNVEWDGEAIEEERKRRMGGTHSRIERILGPLSGCVFFSTILVLPVVLITAILQWGLREASTVLLYSLVFFVPGWAITIGFLRSATMRESIRVGKEIEADFPYYVLVLNRVADNADFSALEGCIVRGS
jgi:hypothetical protein